MLFYNQGKSCKFIKKTKESRQVYFLPQDDSNDSNDSNVKIKQFKLVKFQNDLIV